jgi:AcrR family transcriptional regulator
MPYRRTENVSRKLTARHTAILAAAEKLAAEGGMAAVQIAPVAERAGVATGTVYRYFPSKTHLVAALVTALSEAEIAVLRKTSDAAPGPLSGLAAAITVFAARAVANRRLAFALLAEAVELDVHLARRNYRQALADEFGRRIAAAIAVGHLPDQDATLAAAVLIGAVVEGLVGPLAPTAPADPARLRAQVQTLTLLVLRALGVVDARARGLVVQTPVPLAQSAG